MIWLTSLPAGVLVVGWLALALLVAIGSRLAVRALIPTAERDGAYSIAAPLMPALGAVFAILMALTLAGEASFLASAQGIVGNEAADATRLAWAATSPGVSSAPIQAALLGYLQATRANEWHGTNAAEGADPATARAIGNLENVVGGPAARTPQGAPPPPPPRPWGHPRAPSYLPLSTRSPAIAGHAWPRPHISSPSSTWSS
jgi:hypothetical protein